MKTEKKQNLWKRFTALNGSSVLIAMIVVAILFEIVLHITNPSRSGLIFLTPANLMMILRQQVYIGVIAFGMTLVMLTGNIDLSVGYMLTFLCSVTAAIMMKPDNA